MFLLFVLFIVVPILELMLIIQVGQAVGAWNTVILLVVDSLVGAWLVKHQGTCEKHCHSGKNFITWHFTVS